MSKAWLALTATLPFATASLARTPTYALVITQVSAEARIMGIKLNIKNGEVASLTPCPDGWDIHADNDPSWQARLIGQAHVYEGSISLNELESFVRISPPYAAVRHAMPPGPQSALRVSGSIIVLGKNGELETMNVRRFTLKQVAGP